MPRHRRLLSRMGPSRFAFCRSRRITYGGIQMKEVRLHHYHELPNVEQVAEPKVTGPWDVIVRIGGAGLCRTDLHIIEGQWAEKSGVKLPYTIGHENAGWVKEVGSAVSNVAVGDTVIMHPLITCGFCRACRAGDDMHCANQAFPGISVDGGMANLLKTSARAVVKLEPSLHVKDISEGQGVEAVIDFVGEQGAQQDAVAMLRRAGSHYIIGYGGSLNVPTIDIISTEINFIGNLVGNYNDLAELMTLTAQGKVKLHTATYPLNAALDAIHDLDSGKLRGRGILIP